MKSSSLKVESTHCKRKTYLWTTISGQQDVMVGIHWPRLHALGYASKRQQAISSTGLPASL